MNNSETLKLLATVELACYKCRQALADPKSHGKMRRRIERIIREDRRRRHRRRREEEAMVSAFEKQHLSWSIPTYLVEDTTLASGSHPDTLHECPNALRRFSTTTRFRLYLNIVGPSLLTFFFLCFLSPNKCNFVYNVYHMYVCIRIVISAIYWCKCSVHASINPS